jgi:hypothetical protein
MLAWTGRLGFPHAIVGVISQRKRDLSRVTWHLEIKRNSAKSEFPSLVQVRFVLARSYNRYVGTSVRPPAEVIGPINQEIDWSELGPIDYRLTGPIALSVSKSVSRTSHQVDTMTNDRAHEHKILLRTYDTSSLTQQVLNV